MTAQPNYQEMTRRAAARHGLDPDIFERQIRQESGFNPHARSPAGAEGIAQIMPATARGWGVDPHDPAAALDAAAKNMARYVRQFGSYRNALIAYNAGPGAVGSGHLPAETQNYIRIILGGHDPGHLGTPHGGGGGGGATVTPSPISTLGEGPIKHRAVAGFSVNLPTAEQSTSFDQAGFEQAQKRSILANFIAQHNPHSLLLRSGALSTQTPSMGDFTRTELTTGTEKFTVPGSKATGGGPGPGVPMSGGVDSAGVPGALKPGFLQRANELNARHFQYVWGGNHGAHNQLVPADCSGAVSFVTGVDPRVSGQFEKWGASGAGGANARVRVYANNHHVLMAIKGRDGQFHFFGTSHSNPGGGAGWIPQSALSRQYLSQFVVRHA